VLAPLTSLPDRTLIKLLDEEDHEARRAAVESLGMQGRTGFGVCLSGVQSHQQRLADGRAKQVPIPSLGLCCSEPWEKIRARAAAPSQKQ
jgi:hypothetical protein